MANQPMKFLRIVREWWAERHLYSRPTHDVMECGLCMNGETSHCSEYRAAYPEDFDDGKETKT